MAEVGGAAPYGSRRAGRLAETTRRPAARPGPEVSPLHVGDPDFATPQFIVEAMAAALREGYTHYAQPQGDPELREELAGRLSARSAVPFSASQVVITAGGSPAINAAILATVDPGDRVVIPEPTYSLYADAVTMAGGRCVFVPSTPDLRLDLPALSEAARDARMIVLCNPCNPTGVVLRPNELGAIARLAVAHDLLVLADEAYDHIVFDDLPFVSALTVPALGRRLIYCQTFSKTFAMTGWRLGYVAAPPALAPGIGLMNRTFTGPTNAAVQRAGIAALRSGSDWAAARRHDYQRRRDLVVEHLRALPGVQVEVPEGAFYAFPRFEASMTSAEFVRHALTYGVGLRAGSEFGASGEGHVRVAYCVADDQLLEAMDRLGKVFCSVADRPGR